MSILFKYCRFLTVTSFVVFLAFPGDVIAQLFIKENKRYVGKGRYHIRKGWVNSIGIHGGNLIAAWPLQSVVPPISKQIEYLAYKLVRPKVGRGVGVAYKMITTRQLGYEYYGHYKFVELFAYTKLYQNFNRRRSYFDAKIGYGYALENELIFGCAYCDDPLPLAQRYKSSFLIQPGVGLEFASKTNLRWGINGSVSFNITNLQEDIYPEGGRTPFNGVINYSSSTIPLFRFFLGINLFL